MSILDNTYTIEGKYLLGIYICFFLLAVLTIYICVVNYQLVTQYNNIQSGYRCELYGGLNKSYKYNGTIADGLYWVGTDYYCVWAKDRLFGEQEETDRHEYCHYLVDNDNTHFCFPS
jgi:hypothetical protein